MHLVAAAAATGGVGSLNTLRAWLAALIGIAIIVTGLRIIGRKHEGNNNHAMSNVIVVFVGLFVIGIGQGNNADQFSAFLVGLTH